MNESIKSIPAFPGGVSRPRLLIVDDEADIRELHALLLDIEGYDVQTACDGAAALERLASEQFDLVVTDRAMPNLDGAAMVLAMRTAGITIPVVMVSGSLALVPLPPKVACEIAVIISKPARSKEILSAVALALHSSQNRNDRPHLKKLQEQPALQSKQKPHQHSFKVTWPKIITAILVRVHPLNRKASSENLPFNTTATRCHRTPQSHS